VPQGWPSVPILDSESRPEQIALSYALVCFLTQLGVQLNSVVSTGTTSQLVLGCVLRQLSFEATIAALVEGRAQVLSADELLARQTHLPPAQTSTSADFVASVAIGLSDAGAGSLDGDFVVALASCERPAHAAIAELHALIARLYVGGATIDWDSLYGASGVTKCVLPSYPFERSSYWVGTESEPAQSHRVEIVPRPSATGGSPPRNATSSPNESLVTAAPPRASAQLELDDAVQLVVREASRVLELDTSDVAAGVPLVELGMDSLLAIELQDRLEGVTGVRMGLDSLVQSATPLDVARLLIAQTGAPI
jgi:acyl transferase domain-containing protein